MVNGWIQAPPVIPFAPNSNPKPEWGYFPDGPPSPPKPSPVVKPGPDIFFLLDTVNSPIPPGQGGLNMCWTLSPPPPGWTPPSPPPAAADVVPPSPLPAANKASPPPAAAPWFSGAPSINGWTLVAPPPPPIPTPVPAAAAAMKPPVETRGHYRIVSSPLQTVLTFFSSEAVVDWLNSSTN